MAKTHAPIPMEPETIANLRAFFRGESCDELWDGRDGMEAIMVALLDDRDWHRARVDVTEDDVKRVWLAQEGWAGQRGRGLPYNDGGSFCHWKRDRATVCVFEHESAACIAGCIQSLAGVYERAPLDILDEMAAMEPAP